jgi:hypothetical protein
MNFGSLMLVVCLPFLFRTPGINRTQGFWLEGSVTHFIIFGKQFKLSETQFLHLGKWKQWCPSQRVGVKINERKYRKHLFSQGNTWKLSCLSQCFLSISSCVFFFKNNYVISPHILVSVYKTKILFGHNTFKNIKPNFIFLTKKGGTSDGFLWGKRPGQS